MRQQGVNAMTNEQINSLPTKALKAMVLSTTLRTYQYEVEAAKAELARRAREDEESRRW